MKALPYLTAGALALGTLASADAQIGIGLRAGIITSSEKFENTVNGNREIVDESNVTGFTVGIPVEIAISNVFSIQPELNFQQRGTKFSQQSSADGIDLSQDFEQEFNYLEVPLLFKLGYTTESFTVAAVAGPTVNYALGGTRTFSDVVSVDDGEIQSQVADEVDIDFDAEGRNRTTFGGHLGVQGGIPAGGGKIILDARYQVGFTNLNDGNDDNNSDLDAYETRDRGFSATLGYMITLGDY